MPSAAAMALSGRSDVARASRSAATEITAMSAEVARIGHRQWTMIPRTPRAACRRASSDLAAARIPRTWRSSASGPVSGSNRNRLDRVGRLSPGRFLMPLLPLPCPGSGASGPAPA